MNLSEKCLSNEAIEYLAQSEAYDNEPKLIQSLASMFQNKTLHDFQLFCNNTFKFSNIIDYHYLFNCSLDATLFKNNSTFDSEEFIQWVIKGVLYNASETTDPRITETNTVCTVSISCENEDNENKILKLDDIKNLLNNWIENMADMFIDDDLNINHSDIPLFNKNIKLVVKECLINKFNEFMKKRDELMIKLKTKKGTFSFTEMLLSLEPGKIIEFKDEFDNIRCGIFNNMQVHHTWTGDVYYIYVKGIEIGMNNTLYTMNLRYSIVEFKGTKNIKDLPVQLLQNKTKQYLTTRGKKIINIIKNSSKYMNYTGYVIQMHPWFGIIKSKAIGRCMIDINAFCKFNPNHTITHRIDDMKDRASNVSINDENIIMLPSIIQGYSLVLKKWVSFNADQLEEIIFNPDAYKLLVMDEKLKIFLNKLCNSYNKFSDIVNCKSGGQIVLLYGTPGTGKTLTAETLAELKQVPLYIVTAGELGVELQEMEKKLNDLLELAEIWNAIILLDEADIFLEKRTSNNDIERNAMVGVFLRKLEYFNGIMILTSNRKDIIDDAIMSRITVSINYPNLNHSSRKTIWKNLISAQKDVKFKLSEKDFDKLANNEINGRQIKNIIKNTMWISESNSTITYKDIYNVLCLSIDNNNCKEEK